MATKSPPLPPPAFADFDFTFDPALSNLFPNPPQLPPSEQLFSQDETLDLLGFLDNFQGLEWDMAAQEASFNDFNPSMHLPPNHHPHHAMHEDLSPMLTRSSHQRPNLHLPQHPHSNNGTLFMNIDPPEQPSIHTSPSIPSSSPTIEQLGGDGSLSASRSKPLLSTPQKRLNHIMSEQKRRNAIRDGYAQLISLLSPAGAPHGIGMPTRGRPKGSGVRGKGQTKGKSGVLFRSVEYVKWLEEGRDALRAEVLRVEAAAGISAP